MLIHWQKVKPLNTVNFDDEVYRKLEHHIWVTLLKGFRVKPTAFYFSGGF